MRDSDGTMRVGIYLVLAVLALLAAPGCKPTINVESSIDPSFETDLDRVFVVIDTRKIDEATQRIWAPGQEFGRGVPDTTCFMKVFLRALVADFESVEVEARGHAVTGLELSPDVIRNKIRAFEPDAVINVNQEWFEVTIDRDPLGIMESRDVTAIDLNASIPDSRNSRNVAWRALLKAKAGPNEWDAMAKSLSRALVDRLVADGLVRPGSNSREDERILREGV